MKTLSNAQLVIRILKNNGYEAFIVGGAVRDQLLHRTLTDIDITTNAKPYQVSKLFDAKPTGLKYGTVTVYFRNEPIEVTTYRVDGPYTDSRHPDQVTFARTVMEDVKRRDFTINGLLMDENLRVYDYVNGRKDIQSKFIRAIGDPYLRFSEDAIRMLRAIYFQSKLGFQITKETREAIYDLRDKLQSVAMERVLLELVKILKGKHLKVALKTMITTEVHKMLPGLEKGIEYVVTLDEMPFVDVFFTLCFTLNKGIVPSKWPFSNKQKHRYLTAAKLANSKDEFNALDLYTYGIDLCLLASRVNYMLKRGRLMQNELMEQYKNLPIQSELDLKLKPYDMMDITGKKAGAWLKDMQYQMVLAILNKEIINDQEVLKDYLIKHMK
jgi:tRNA nucleotidyltransferase (CCA-adding enzyme)